jgi:hypothetical protein
LRCPFFGKELRIFGNQLNLIAYLVKLDQL